MFPYTIFGASIGGIITFIVMKYIKDIYNLKGEMRLQVLPIIFGMLFGGTIGLAYSVEQAYHNRNLLE
jgi:hypothetical protein